MSTHAQDQILALPAINVDRAEFDFDREQILTDAYQFHYWAVQGDDVLLATPKGVTLLRTDQLQGIVDIDHVPTGRKERVHFWINAQSVQDLSTRLKDYRKTHQRAWPEPGQLEL